MTVIMNNIRECLNNLPSNVFIFIGGRGNGNGGGVPQPPQLLIHKKPKQ